jgi:hypothetical protein
MDVTALLGDQRGKAREELYDLIEGNPALRQIMTRHDATRDVLESVYWGLMRAGAGQWARGHWVPASALAFGSTLDFVLTATENGKPSGRDTWDNVAIKVIDYFERGSVSMKI